MQFIYLSAILLVLLSACESDTPTPEGVGNMPSFTSPEEQVEGWYHRHEWESWLAKGAEKEVAQSVLAKIAAAPGNRADERWIDSIAEYGPGNWIYEWSQVGELAMSTAAAAEAAGEHARASSSYRAALAYFTIASWPHLGNEEDRAALDRARRAYLKLGARLPVPVTHPEFPVGGLTARGYLHLPPGDGPFPTVLLTYGSDVTKEDGLSLFEQELLRRGIAMFSVDMPGIGEGYGLSMLDGSDQVLAAASRWLRAESRIDSTRIFIVGASFGGNAAARAFLTLGDLAGVISMCGPLHAPFMAPAAVFDALPALTIDGVKSRVGLKGQSSEALAEVAPQLSLKMQGLFEGESIDTPLLILTTNQDPVAPLSDLEGLIARASRAQTVILDEVGHCPPRWLRQPIIGRWVADQLEARTIEES